MSFWISGAKPLIPVTIIVVPFGIAWAVAGQAAGLPDEMILAMSVFVFAGASQFASLEIIGPEMSFVALALVTFAVNARHILMGTTVYPDIRDASLARQMAMVLTLTDGPYALMQTEPNAAQRIALMVAGGWAIWLSWLVGTAIGLFFGNLVGDPRTFGFDAVMPIFFLIVLTSVFKGKESLLPWIGAAVAAVAWQQSFGGNWHVLVGAITGGCLSALRVKS